MACETCEGTGRIPCGNCNGGGSVGIDDGDHDGEEDLSGTAVTCVRCNGSGEIDCPDCDGDGDDDDDDDDADTDDSDD
jgi:hypothetical protein